MGIIEKMRLDGESIFRNRRRQRYRETDRNRPCRGRQ